MNVAMRSIAEAPSKSDPVPPTPEPSTREIIRNLTRELREDVGEQAVETVVAANPWSASIARRPWPPAHECWAAPCSIRPS